MQPRLKPSRYGIGLGFACVVNMVLVLFIYQIVTDTSVSKSQETITLDFRKFKSKDLNKLDPLPEKLAKITKKPEFKKLARPGPSITTTPINAIKKVSFPLMTAEKFNITPVLFAIEQPDITAKNSTEVQVNSGLISAKPVYQLPPYYPPRAEKNGSTPWQILKVRYELKK